MSYLTWLILNALNALVVGGFSIPIALNAAFSILSTLFFLCSRNINLKLRYLFGISFALLLTSASIINLQITLVSMITTWLLTLCFLLGMLIGFSVPRDQLPALLKDFTRIISRVIAPFLFLSLIFGRYDEWNGYEVLLLNPATWKFLSLLIIPFLGFRVFDFIFIGLAGTHLITGTDAGAGAFLISFSVFIILNLNLKVKKLPLALIAAVFLILYFMNLEFIENRFAQGNIVTRIVIWQIYLDMLKDFPFGGGFNGFYYYLSENGFVIGDSIFENHTSQDLQNMYQKRQSIIEAREIGVSYESVIVQIISGFGLLAVIYILYILPGILLRIVRSFYADRSEDRLICSLIGCFVFGVFNSFDAGFLLLPFFVIGVTRYL